MYGRSIIVGMVVLVLVGVAVAILFLKKRNRQLCSNFPKEQEIQDADCQKKQLTKMKVRIRVTRNEHCQINIHCYNMEQEKLGELLAEYTWENGCCPEKKGNAVHLEQIFVKRFQRKKGIGKLMFAYLIQEMLVLEKQYGKEFQQIYGEVGRDGTDEPRSSIPFYKKMSNFPYGDSKVLSLQIEKGVALDGLDAFTYHIVRK